MRAGDASLALLRDGGGRRLGPVPLPEIEVRPAPGHQLVVGALLDDGAVVDHQDAVAAPGGAQPVRDHDRGPPAQPLLQVAPDLGLGGHVQRAGRLVQDRDRGVADERPRQGQALALPARQGGAVLAQDRVVALGQLLDEGLGLGAAGGLPHLRGIRVPRAPRDVLEGGGPEDDRLLQHQGDLPPERRQPDPAQVVAVDGDAPALGIEEAQHEPGQGALARPGPPHDGHVLAGGDAQVDVAEHRPAVVVGEAHVLEPDLAGDRRQRLGVGRVLDVELRVEHREDTLEAHAGRADLGEVLAQAEDGLVEVAQVGEEHGQLADGQGAAHHPERAEPDDRRGARGQQGLHHQHEQGLGPVEAERQGQAPLAAGPEVLDHPVLAPVGLHQLHRPDRGLRAAVELALRLPCAAVAWPWIRVVSQRIAR